MTGTMLRLAASLILTIASCLMLKAGLPQYLGSLDVSIDTTSNERIMIDPANAKSGDYVIIISSALDSLSIGVKCTSLDSAMFVHGIDCYDLPNREYVHEYYVKPPGGKEYEFEISRKGYFRKKIRLDGRYFKGGQVKIIVNGERLTPAELFERGMQFYKGDGVEQNYYRAFRFFEGAAAGGHAESMYYIGLLYDYWNKRVQAKKWYERAAEHNIIAAGNALRRLAETQGERRPLGISVGYMARQLRTPDGSFPWCGIGDLARSSSPAWTVGLYWAPEFKYGLGIQTGIYADFASDSYKDISVFDCNVSIPVRVQYRYAILNNFSVFVFTGPGFDMGLAYNVDIDGHPEDGFSLYDTADISRFNLTWGFGAGLRWNGLQIMFTSDWGLLNVLKDSKDRVRLNKPFGVSIAYNFKLK